MKVTINTDSKEIRFNERGNRVWMKKCKGDEQIYEKSPQNCWHPLLPQPGQETGTGIFCLKCLTTLPLLWRREDKYYQDVLA